MPNNADTVKSALEALLSDLQQTRKVFQKAQLSDFNTESFYKNIEKIRCDYSRPTTSELNKGNNDRAATIIAKQKLLESTKQLSGAAGGRRMLKSVHGTYIRAYDSEWKVDLMRGDPREWEHWFVEDWGGKVVFKAIHSPGRFLRALPCGKVDLVPTHPHFCPELIWKPFRNSDGTWSFLSIHGTWLSGLGNGVVCCMLECKSSEKFTLPWW
uniref:Uncharacterized protein n=1 Tax=Caenorhabditis japonica TaxID=281687 RepID=A0A8R1IMD2_CAEJA